MTFFLLVCALQVLENHSLFNQSIHWIWIFNLFIKILTYFFNENFEVLLFILRFSFDLELIFVVWYEVKGSVCISDLVFNFLSMFIKSVPVCNTAYLYPHIYGIYIYISGSQFCSQVYLAIPTLPSLLYLYNTWHLVRQVLPTFTLVYFGLFALSDNFWIRWWHSTITLSKFLLELPYIYGWT